MTLEEFINWLGTVNDGNVSQGMDDFKSQYGSLGWFDRGNMNQYIWDYAKNTYGDNYLDMQGYLTGVKGFTYNPEWESWLNNMIAVQNQSTEHDWSQMMRDTDLTSSASQLSELGLNPASVISIGRGSAPVMDAAGVDRSDNANSRAQRELQRKQNITNRVFSLLSGMAAAGLGMAAFKGPKAIAARMANSTAKEAKKAFGRGSIDLGSFNGPTKFKPATVSSRLLYTDSDTWN